MGGQVVNVGANNMKQITLDYNSRYLKHSWKVVPRIQERIKREIDVENGCYDQLYSPHFYGTHPMYDFNTKKRRAYIRKLQGKLDWNDKFCLVAIVLSVVLFATHLIILGLS